MEPYTLEAIEYVYGIFTVIFVFLSIIIGIKIMLNYRSTSEKYYITFGLTWIFMGSGWWGQSVTFFTAVFMQQRLDDMSYLFISNFFVSIAVICWMYSISTILYQDKKKKQIITVITCVVFAIFEILFITLLLTNITLIGTVGAAFYYSTGIFTLILHMTALTLAIGVGGFFAMKSMKMPDKKLQWRGRFLLMAFIIFSLSAGFETFFKPLDSIALIIERLFLMVSAITYYFGFFLPDKLATFLIKTE